MSDVASFQNGQRWLSNSESELGLGIVIKTDIRAVEIYFPAVAESRIYTKQNAPLSRLILAEGDQVKTAEGWVLSISALHEQDGLVIYSGIREDNKDEVILPETQLDHSLQMDKPEERLFNLQFDAPKWFDLRLEALQHRHQHATSVTCGLIGARVSLIPHQIHIASEVAKRYAPRVLLADEVGLGKTIEAALIIHQQLLTGRAQRILILVPDSLVHQWMVEMLRKVNLSFSIFDDSRWQAMRESQQGNPFEQEQLVLCSTQFIAQSSEHLHACSSCDWDLVVVDEAHHLSWSEECPSAEYLAVEQVSAQSKGLILLTATPDQLGHESHFARLRLLDPDRFSDYASFLQEESEYSALASAVSPLLNNTEVSDAQLDVLRTVAPEIMQHHTELSSEEQRQDLLNQLIDGHGTGRLLFRNRRASIEGFPSRHLLTYPIEQNACHSERAVWLMEKLGELKPAKVLLICQHASTVIELGETLRQQSGIRYTVFHEGMSIVERDKSAQYFADSEQGAQIMLCSEIGSEGRNFQFAHHLILFDLPERPDLLEQRIGRLDRIGQSQDINIHVPYREETADEIRLKWFHEGLNAFEKTCPTGQAVYEAVDTLLNESLDSPNDENKLRALIEVSAKHNSELQRQLEDGRDRLLELSASGLHRAEPILDEIIVQDSAQTLPRFMSRLFDSLGVNQDERDSDTYILTPTESMINHLPGLHQDGMTITYKRQVATALEQLHFLTWDHSLVHNAIDALVLDVHGKSSMGFIADPDMPKGAYWLECLFVLQASGPKYLQVERFLPNIPIRIVVDAQNSESEIVFENVRPVNRKTAKQLLGALHASIENHLEHARRIAHHKSNQILHDALASMDNQIGGEVQRLEDLRQHNPSVRQSEIDFFSEQAKNLHEILNKADVSLDAVRVIINNP